VHGLRITTATLTSPEARRFAQDLREALAG